MRVQGHMSKVSSHKGKLHVVGTGFSIEVYKQTIASYNKSSKVNSLLSATLGRGTKALSKDKFVFFKKQIIRLFVLFSYKHSEFLSQNSILGTVF